MSESTGDFGFPEVDLPESVLSSTDAIVAFLVAQLVRLGQLPKELSDQVVRQVLHRESLGSTVVGCGFALPHTKHNAVKEVLGVVGRCSKPALWTGAVDADPVHLICLLVTPASEPATSLRALEAVIRQLRRQ